MVLVLGVVLVADETRRTHASHASHLHLHSLGLLGGHAAGAGNSVLGSWKKGD